MRSGQTSHELFAHFDHPKAVVCSDFDWDENAIGPAGFESASGATDAVRTVDETLEDSVQPLARRDTFWVLKWAAAATVFAVSAATLCEYGSTLAAEHALRQAAEAGIVEATLPRASRQTVLNAIERRLPQNSIDPRELNFTLLADGQPVTGRLKPREGDRLSIILSANISSPFSAWLNKNGRAPLTVRTDREVPGRHLKPRTR
jgi:hypothetical protein